MKLDNYLPTKEDYPDNLEILKKIDSQDYCYAIEASASAYFNSSKIIQRLFFKRLEKTRLLVDKKKYSFSLDAGTGIGVMLPFLSKISQNVKAVDYTDIINYAEAMAKKKRLGNITFEKCDINTLQAKEKFDLIICLSVLEHIGIPEIVFKHFKDILSPKGTLIIGYPIENRLIKTIRYVEAMFRRNISKKVFKNSYKKTENFTGHVSGWKKIDTALAKYFNVYQKVDLRFCSIKYYALRKVYNDGEHNI